MMLEKIANLFKKEKKQVISVDYGASEFASMEKDGVVENGTVTCERLSVAKNHIYRAWAKGYQNFTAIYKPESSNMVSIDRLNNELQHLDDLGVKYKANLTNEEIIISINR